MKALIPSAVMFFIVVALIVTNTVLLQGLFSDVSDALDSLPDSDEAVSTMSERQKAEYRAVLDGVEKKWKSYEQYIYITLAHDVSGEFFDSFLPAKEYFESGDYSSYLASLSSSKDILKQIKHNEGVAFGTLF